MAQLPVVAAGYEHDGRRGGCHRLPPAWRHIRLAGFVAGCVAGAILEFWFDIGALALPVMLAVALGDQKGRTYEQF